MLNQFRSLQKSSGRCTATTAGHFLRVSSMRFTKNLAGGQHYAIKKKFPSSLHNWCKVAVHFSLPAVSNSSPSETAFCERGQGMCSTSVRYRHLHSALSSLKCAVTAALECATPPKKNHLYSITTDAPWGEVPCHQVHGILTWGHHTPQAEWKTNV